MLPSLVDLYVYPQWTVVAQFITNLLNPNLAACQTIAASLSPASDVFYPGSAAYNAGIKEWVASSQQLATCTVEPATPEDVSIVMKVLAKTKVPFGIKCRGHMANKASTSTTGVQITLLRLNDTVYDEESKIVTIDAGQSWDQVYTKLQPYNVTVVGGRDFGVGVGGQLLGGGYSWISNRRGLSVDNILEYELVLPSGEIVTVNADSHPDLFFGLKGGFNNFGIVTKFKLPAFSQGLVWGGIVIYSAEHTERFINALAKFSATNKDMDAMLLTAIMGTNGTTLLGLAMYYNGPEYLNGIYDEFLDIPAISSDLGTRTLVDHITTISAGYQNHDYWRGAQYTTSLTSLTVPVLNEVVAQATRFSNFAPGATAALTVQTVFPDNVLRANTSATAWPHSTLLSPFVSYFWWPNEEDDAIAEESIRVATSAVEAAVVADGQGVDEVYVYGNYAHSSHSPEKIYGPNLPRLREIAARYDPQGVMKRTGGFKF